MLKHSSKFSPVLRHLRSYLTNTYNVPYYMLVIIIILKWLKVRLGVIQEKLQKREVGMKDLQY